MLFKLAEWEDNGNHDSYFYGIVFNDETGSLEEHCIGATAYAGGCSYPGETQAPTREVFETVTEVAVARLTGWHQRLEGLRVTEPTPADLEVTRSAGGQVITIAPCKTAERERVERCDRCVDGWWVNPGDEDDRRECFSCYGLGWKFGPVKKPRAYTPIPVGSVGELVTVGEFFGVSYDRGYNQPG